MKRSSGWKNRLKVTLDLLTSGSGSRRSLGKDMLAAGNKNQSEGLQWKLGIWNCATLTSAFKWQVATSLLNQFSSSHSLV